MVGRRTTDARAAMMLLLAALALPAAGCGKARSALDQVAEAASGALEISPAVHVEALDRALAAEVPGPADLTLTRVGFTFRLSWTGDNPGDYNLDGVVTGGDLFVIAANFDRGIGEEQGLECADGNGDGVIDGMDLFTISVNFLNRVDGWNVFFEEDPDAGFLNQPYNGALIPYAGCGAGSEYYFDDPYDVRVYAAVRSADLLSGTHGGRSNVVHPALDLGHPDPFTAEATEDGVNLAWDNDWANRPWFAGWNLYRRCAEGGLSWTRLTDEPLTETEYSDTSMTLGGAVVYRITAVDWYGQETEGVETEAVTFPGLWQISQLYPVDDWDSLRGNAVGMNGDGNPVVAFWENVDGAEPGAWTATLRYGVREAGVWQFETVAEFPGSGDGLSLAFDSDGDPVLAGDAYQGGVYPDGYWNVLVWRRKEGEWSSTGLSVGAWAYAPRIVSGDTSFVTGGLYVTFGAHDGGIGSVGENMIKLAVCENDVWDVFTLDPNETNRPGNLAIDRDGNLKIGYYHEDNDFKIATWDGAAATSESLYLAYGFNLYTGTNTVDFTLDNDFNPAFAFRGRNRPVLARYRPEAWTERELYVTGQDTELIFDFDNSPLLLVKSGSSSASIAWHDGVDWIFSELYPGSGSEYASIALDAAGNPLVSLAIADGLYFAEVILE